MKNVKKSARAGIVKSLDGKRTITLEEFDRLFESGSDEIDLFLDWSKAEVKPPVSQKVNVDFPAWMVSALDREADRVGVPRQSLIKLWLAERLEKAG